MGGLFTFDGASPLTRLGVERTLRAWLSHMTAPFCVLDDPERLTALALAGAIVALRARG